MAASPTDLLPYDGLIVTAPPAFSWTPGANTGGIYLNVSTSPTIDPINVINYHDDGSHYFRDSVEKFKNLIGAKLYWRLIYDGNPTPVRNFVVGGISVDPFYNVVHIGWPGGAEGWDPHNLDSLKLATLTAIKNQVGGVGDGTDRKLAFSFHVPYFFTGDLGHYKNLLKKLFELSEQASMPVLIGLDGFEWWGGRPDLWNWWDQAKPGYDPNNKHNVEWTGWSPDQAVQGGWRNWGSPFQMAEPHPNLSSPKVINANKQALQELAPVISQWYNALAADRKYLLAAVKVGWEVNIGVNYYYPQSGNNSPNQGHQIGYAAVSTSGLASSGEIKREHLTSCVQHYMAELTETVYQAGLPRRKIVTHIGSPLDNTATPIRYIYPDAALSPWSIPGISNYSFADGPIGMAGTLDQIGPSATWWGTVEWGGSGAGKWDQLLATFEQYRNCKILNSFAGLNAPALQKIINTSPRAGSRRHWIHPPLLRVKTQGSTAILSWDAPSQADKVYLNVTTSANLTFSGGFQQITVANEDVTGKNDLVLSNLASGTYYWKLFADGRGRRVISDIGVFAV
jgi:hypothetical protein